MIYSSELVTKALHLAPTGTPYEGDDCVCAMCQREIRAGTLTVPKKLKQTFFDFGHLAPSDVLCGYCAVATNQTVMRELQRCVITRDGIYNLNTDDARAWFWLTPPEPPFVVVINHNVLGAFHYFWRTPVTLDADFIQFNVDDVLYQVRRQRVLRALEYSKLLIERASVLEKKKGVMKSPFMVLIRSPSTKAASNHGVMAKDAITLASMFPDCAEAVSFLTTLTPGELIALSPMVKQKPATPVKPELITAVTPKSSTDEKE